MAGGVGEEAERETSGGVQTLLYRIVGGLVSWAKLIMDWHPVNSHVHAAAFKGVLCVKV